LIVMNHDLEDMKRGPEEPSQSQPKEPRTNQPRGRGGFRNDRGNAQNDNKNKPKGAFADMFSEMGKQLDEQNDRRERLVKISRDITIHSKRVIFLLHRIYDEENVIQKAHESLVPIRQNFEKISDELVDQDYYKFLRAFSPGVQEYLECVSFLEFLENDKLLTKEKAEADLLKSNSKGIPFILTDKDYLGGIADLTGELMRLCINTVPSGNHQFCNKITEFVRNIYDGFCRLPTATKNELTQKIEIMQQSLLKVENVCFNIKVRGSEYPKEMLANNDEDPMDS